MIGFLFKGIHQNKKQQGIYSYGFIYSSLSKVGHDRGADNKHDSTIDNNKYTKQLVGEGIHENKKIMKI